jgi:hypothetical protein
MLAFTIIVVHTFEPNDKKNLEWQLASKSHPLYGAKVFLSHIIK